MELAKARTARTTAADGIHPSGSPTQTATKARAAERMMFADRSCRSKFAHVKPSLLDVGIWPRVAAYRCWGRKSAWFGVTFAVREIRVSRETSDGTSGSAFCCG